MRISRLELYGFKSFADRTVFHFGDGISCVVGPNGCGKSNVVDALRWAMGEQSARSLRGGEMADVIFAGSAERKPVGYAEVGITLATDDETPFPGEFARFGEVHVARRLYRNGNSEYLINHTRCRRRDIVDFFMDTGGGNNLYSFIEQGRIDKIVSASPADRRTLIDEAAGITRYKQRRHEAMNKLEATAGQLDRAADVADEMERRLRTLERQVIKAAKFRRLRALVRLDEVFLGMVQARDMHAEMVELEASRGGLADQLVDVEARLQELEDQLALDRGELEVAVDRAEQRRDALSELDATRRGAEATATARRERVSDLEERLHQARDDKDAALQRVTSSETLITERGAQRTEAEAEITSAAAAVEQRSGELEAARQSDGVAREALLSERAEAALRQRQFEAQQTELEGLATEAEALPERLEALEARVTSRTAEDVVVGKRLEVSHAILDERSSLKTGLGERLSSLDVEVDTAERAEAEARRSLRAADTSLESSQRALDGVIKALDAAAGRADEAVQAAVARARVAADTRADAEDQADQSDLEALVQDLRAALATAERTGREQIEVSERDLRSAQETERSALEQQISEELAHSEEALRDAERSAMEAVAAAGVQAQEDAAAAVASAREAAERAEAELEASQQKVRDVDAQLQKAQRELASLETRIATLEAELQAATASGEFDELWTSVVKTPQRLMDALRVPESDQQRVAYALGGRLGLPMVTVDEALAIAGRIEGGAATLQLRPDELSVGALMTGWEEVDSLEAAIAHQRAHGQGAWVIGSGDRVSADGVVSLGQSGAREAELLQRQAQLDAELPVRDAARDAVNELKRALLLARASVESKRVTLRKHRERVANVEREAQHAAAEASRTERSQQDMRLEEMRATHAERSRAARAQQESWEVDAREAVRALRATGRERLNATLQELQGAQDRQAAEAREQLTERQRARRRGVDEAVDAARTEALESAQQDRKALSAQRRRLEREVTTLRTARDEARAHLEGLEPALRKLHAERDRVRLDLADHEVVIARVHAELEGATAQREALNRELADLKVEVSRTRAAVGTVTERRRAAVDALEAHRVAVAGATERLRDAERTASHAALQQEQAREAFESARDRHQHLRELVVRLGAEMEAARTAGETAKHAADDALARLDDLRVRRDAAVTDVADSERELSRLATQRDDLAGALDTARQALATVRGRLEAREQEQRACRERFDVDHRALIDLDHRYQNAASKASTIEQRLMERYQQQLSTLLEDVEKLGGITVSPTPEAAAGLTIGNRVVEPVPEHVIRLEHLSDEGRVRDAVARLEERREKLGRLGDVHLGALTEYEELAERFAELDAQKADLEESVASIRAAIANLNKTCRERFREAFDRVSEAFAEAYPNLVGATGEARIELTDEEDLLEAGVEIYVRPPGKRLQNLSLLSGGEKAMTAIALLLALFTVKPSPFCVLDEVDAPLDEANGQRFNDMIVHMSSMTQFIVITHNRKTMECADTLYGITMATAGCSGLVSVEVD